MPRHLLLLACSAAAPRATALVAPRPRVVARPATSLPPPPPRRPSLALTQRRRPLVLQAKPIAAAEKYTLYDSRWAHLFMLSFLAFVSDWVCFATAAVPGEWMVLEGHEASELVDIFLCANVFSCFLYTDVTAAVGLRRAVTAAALATTTRPVGCPHTERADGHRQFFAVTSCAPPIAASSSLLTAARAV